MNRRHFIISGSTLTAAVAAGWFVLPSNKDKLSIASVIDRLVLMRKQPVSFYGDWNSFQTFTHLAQSVEYSMLGYPEHKSELFKSTLGKSAFNVFSSKGYMKHNLEESIPGAPSLSAEGSSEDAINRLIVALQNFSAHNGELAEHFAYGALTKDEYAIAHVLHIHDHFSQLKAS